MLKRFIKYYGPHKKLFILDLCAAIISSLLAIILPFITRDLLRTYVPQKSLSMIIFLIGIMFAIYFVNLILNYIRITWGHIMGARMETDMRRDIFQHLQKFSFTYYDNMKTGHIMSRISNDLNIIAEIAHHAPEDLLISIIILIGAYSVMFFFNWQLTVISLIPIPFLILWGILVGGRMRGSFRKVRKEIAEINSSVENSVQGIREVKAYTNESLEELKFQKVNMSFKKALEKTYKILGRFHSVFNFLRDIYYLTVISGGVFLIYNQVIEVYDLLAFILYVGIILTPIDRLINFLEQIQQGAAAFERFDEIMQIEPDIKDKKNAQPLKNPCSQIKIDNISFKYMGSTENVLNNISLSIEFGQKIAFVGESGAGKSSLVSLIPRFYECQSGIITIGGQNILDLQQQSLRKNIGIVQQTTFLFDASIGENIMYGNPEATMEQMIEAARMANIYDFISRLPEGFDTPVGERGIKLSGGQKQRLSIARVFLKNPPILIFDEATSSLDNESESLIQDAMERLSKNRTTIIIAHRLSTVKNVDCIYVMKKGEIIESGSHQSLLTLNGYYASLYHMHKL